MPAFEIGQFDFRLGSENRDFRLLASTNLGRRIEFRFCLRPIRDTATGAHCSEFSNPTAIAEAKAELPDFAQRQRIKRYGRKTCRARQDFTLRRFRRCWR